MDRDNLGGTPVHDAAEQGQVNYHKLCACSGLESELFLSLR